LGMRPQASRCGSRPSRRPCCRSGTLSTTYAAAQRMSKVPAGPAGTPLLRRSVYTTAQHPAPHTAMHLQQHGCAPQHPAPRKARQVAHSSAAAPTCSRPSRHSRSAMLRRLLKAASSACFLIRCRGAGVMYCRSSSPAAPLRKHGRHVGPVRAWTRIFQDFPGFARIRQHTACQCTGQAWYEQAASTVPRATMRHHRHPHQA
jgi:hypothetical protein